jgi:hypothetical protein
VSFVPPVKLNPREPCSYNNPRLPHPELDVWRVRSTRHWLRCPGVERPDYGFNARSVVVHKACRRALVFRGPFDVIDDENLTGPSGGLQFQPGDRDRDSKTSAWRQGRKRHRVRKWPCDLLDRERDSRRRNLLCRPGPLQAATKAHQQRERNEELKRRAKPQTIADLGPVLAECDRQEPSHDREQRRLPEMVG